MQKRHTHLTNRTALALAALALSPLAHAGDLAADEIIRRQEAVRAADELLTEGRAAYAAGNYGEAVTKYRSAFNTLPYGTATAERRESIKAHLQDGAVALAQDNRRVGKYDEARDLLQEVIAQDADNYAANKQLEYIDDPLRSNPALDNDHTEKVDQVRSYLNLGEGAFELGNYDKAEEHFQNVLRIDPYNKAARRWLENCSAIKSAYFRAAYDDTRANMLMQVDKAWERSLPPIGEIRTTGGGPVIEPGATIAAKLQSINIPLIDFQDTSVEEALDFLRLRSVELDDTTLNESEKGINFVVKGGGTGNAALDGGVSADPNAARIDQLYLTNVPLSTALQYICDKTGLRYKVDEYAVTLLPIGDAAGEDIVTKEWTVPPTFEQFISGGAPGSGGGGSADPFADPDDGGGSSIAARKPIKTLLEGRGVRFADGTSANLLNGTLIVRNSPSQNELISEIVKASFLDTPRQINIRTKFVEVSQENDEQLGFDWVITPFGVGSSLFAGGGTVGSGSALTGADFISPVAYTTIPGIPAGVGDQVSGISTAGNRTGGYAINSNSIDALLNNPSRTSQTTNAAPGILSFTGIFNEGQVQMVMRGLSQKKGTDVMTAPSVMARPGESATIEIIREFIYPTEYEPPELPNNVGGSVNGGGLGLSSGGSSFPVTPATPTTFETRKTGVILEIEPNVGANDSVIDLQFAPEIVEFEGFVNYGSPITSPATDALGNPVQIVITENRIEMPIFSTRKVKTAITIYDGYTVAVGGLMREDIQSVNDKVPILGDLPFVGRLFQSDAENHIKSNLIIFVTAEIIDATGRRMLTDTGNPGPTTGLPGDAPTLLPPGN